MEKVDLRIKFNFDAGIGSQIEEFEEATNAVNEKILEIVGIDAEIDWRDYREVEVHNVLVNAEVKKSQIMMMLLHFDAVEEVRDITDIREGLK